MYNKKKLLDENGILKIAQKASKPTKYMRQKINSKMIALNPNMVCPT